MSLNVSKKENSIILLCWLLKYKHNSQKFVDCLYKESKLVISLRTCHDIIYNMGAGHARLKTFCIDRYQTG